MFSDGAALARGGDDLATCFDSVEVKTLMTSGMIAPASVPQLMIVDSFHHSVGRRRAEVAGSAGTTRRRSCATETSEVSQTSWVSGASKFILSALP